MHSTHSFSLKLRESRARIIPRIVPLTHWPIPISLSILFSLYFLLPTHSNFKYATFFSIVEMPDIAYPPSRIVDTAHGKVEGRRLVHEGERQVDAFQVRTHFIGSFYAYFRHWRNEFSYSIYSLFLSGNSFRRSSHWRASIQSENIWVFVAFISFMKRSHTIFLYEQYEQNPLFFSRNRNLPRAGRACEKPSSSPLLKFSFSEAIRTTRMWVLNHPKWW